MGKSKQKKTGMSSPNLPQESKWPASPLTTSAIAEDAVLGYRMRLLIYDLRNLTKDAESERRLNSTTDERYIGPPYLNAEQSAVIKGAIVDVRLESKQFPDMGEYITSDEDGNNSKTQNDLFHLHDSEVNHSFEAMLGALLERFWDKRRASADARPCGPHHLAPLYAALFGIKLDEIQDPKFLSRVKRQKLDV